MINISHNAKCETWVDKIESVQLYRLGDRSVVKVNRHFEEYFTSARDARALLTRILKEAKDVDNMF